ncbi:MAG: HU family DNA-binding protein [bacterium]|nr:HU family DNA-binding protein [Candidatus Minthenecus merdequi]
MTKNEIISSMSERTGVSRADIRLFLERFNEALFQGLNEDQLVKIKGLGTFKLVSVKTRKSININGGETIDIPAHNKISFTADKLFAEMVNDPLAHLQVVELSDTPSEEDDPAEEGGDEYVASSRMKKLSEEAEVLKSLIADINGLPSVLQIEESEGEKIGESVEEKIEEPEEEKIEEPKISIYTPITNNSDNYLEDEIKKKEMTYGGKVGRIFLSSIVLLGIILGIIYWKRYVKDVKQEKTTQAETHEIINLSKDKESVVSYEKDTSKDSIKQETELSMATINESEVQSAKTIERETDSNGKLNIEQMRKINVDYSVIQGTETVRDGSRLTMIALRAYGSKDFWIYVFLANRDQLGNPAQINTGMIIKIPKIDKRLIDTSNPDCLQYAKELEKRYVK